MANISTYTLDSDINPNDKIIGTDGTTGEDQGKTKNFSVSAIRSFVGSASVVTKKVTITSEQLLSLDGGGTVELIEAPGAGKVIVPVSIIGFVDYNTTEYDFSSDINVVTGTSGQVGILPKVALNKVTISGDIYFCAELVTSGQALSSNAALNIYTTSETVTQGDSPLTLSITYRIVDFS